MLLESVAVIDQATEVVVDIRERSQPVDPSLAAYAGSLSCHA